MDGKKGKWENGQRCLFPDGYNVRVIISIGHRQYMTHQHKIEHKNTNCIVFHYLLFSHFLYKMNDNMIGILTLYIKPKPPQNNGC